MLLLWIILLILSWDNLWRERSKLTWDLCSKALTWCPTLSDWPIRPLTFYRSQMTNSSTTEIISSGNRWCCHQSNSLFYVCLDQKNKNMATGSLNSSWRCWKWIIFIFVFGKYIAFCFMSDPFHLNNVFSFMFLVSPMFLCFLSLVIDISYIYFWNRNVMVIKLWTRSFMVQEERSIGIVR